MPPIESGTYIDSLVATNPVATDQIAVCDDHLRLIKSTIKASFPNITGAMTADHTELSVLDGITATTAELNILDGVTATAAEINYLSGVTSNIQTQLNTINTDLVNDTTPQLGGQLDTNGQSIAFGNWTIVGNGAYLEFKYANVTKIKLGSAGNITAADDITAFGTP
jgi:hypothetical protein